MHPCAAGVRAYNPVSMSVLTVLLVVLPFLVGILLANLAERNSNLRVLQIVYLVALNSGLVFVGLMSISLGFLAPVVTVSQPQPAPLQQVDWFGGGFALIAGGVIALVVLLPAVRRWLARVFDIQPGSILHATALSMTATVLGGNAYQMVLSRAVLTPEGLAQLSQQGLDLTYLDTLVFPLLTFSLAGLIGVGLFTRRNWNEVLERIGLTMPRPWHLGLVVAVTAVFLGFSILADRVWMALDPNSLQQVGSVSNALLGNFTGLAGAFAIGLTAGIGEEVFFRGAYQPRFGILMSALVFTSFHIQYFLSVATLVVLIVGIMLGVLRKQTSLTVCILVHFLYNFASVLLAGG